MFDFAELRAAGIERREDHRGNWRHADCPYRIASRRRYHDYTYKRAESVRYLLAAFRAGQ